MAIEVFNRHEIKYKLDEKTFRQIEGRLSEYMELDPYNKSSDWLPKNDNGSQPDNKSDDKPSGHNPADRQPYKTYTITNLYYDTEDNRLILHSLAKPKYKEKLRLRAYGTPTMDSKVYVEVKKKVNGLVNKRRSTLTLEEAYGFLQSGIPPAPQPYHNRQVLHEIEYILQAYKLRPALYLAYDRRAYFGIGQQDLRVSFDCQIRSRQYDLGLENGNYGEPLLENGKWLMEVKVSNSIPVWLCRLLSEYKVYPASFSKYGTAYKRLLGNRAPQKIYRYTHEQPITPLSAIVAN